MLLNERFTFANFVFAEANRAVETALKRFADSSGPGALLICGGAGQGKTHLLQAVGHRARAADPSCHPVLIQSGRSLRDSRTAEGERWIRAEGLILMDDIDLHGADMPRRDHPEGDLSADGFRGRFACTAVRGAFLDRVEENLPPTLPRVRVDLAPLDRGARITILERLNERMGQKFPADALLSLATHDEGNYRSLESSLIRIGAYQSLVERPIDLEVVSWFLPEKAGR